MNNNINIKLVGMGVAVIAALSACSDVVDYTLPDKYANSGAPEITAIYNAQDTGCVNAITSGMLNQMIHIKGHNLANITAVSFNGVPVDVRSQAYGETNDCWLTIPRVIPERVTDSLVFETQQGKTAIHFPVSIPEMSVSGLANEFALKGDHVQVMGDYFDLYGFSDTTNTATSTIIISNADSAYTQAVKADSITETYMGIIIPDDCPDNSLITFSWKQLGKTMTKTIPYRMSKNLMFGQFGSDVSWWDSAFKKCLTDGNSNGDPISLGYKFIRIKGTYDAWSWSSDGISYTWTNEDAAQNPQKYVLKFEVYTNSSTPFMNYGNNGADGSKNGGYLFTFNGLPGATGNRNQFDPITTFGLQNTYGHWRTVSVPLEDVLQGGKVSAGQTVPLEIVLQPNTTNAWTVDHCFGQFRIEPKTY